MPKLRLHSPASIPGLGSILDISGDDVSVGRAPDNQLVIPESSVSPHHARLQRRGDVWVLTDLGQTNGIWVGVKRVAEHPLSPGQLFRIGGVALEFVDDTAAASALQVVGRSPERAAIIERTKDSKVSEPESVVVKDQTIRDSAPPSGSREPFMASEPSLRDDQDSVSKREPASPLRRYGAQRVVVWLLIMIVLGFAVTFGGYFALRWLSQLQRASRPLTPMTKLQPSNSGVAAPVAPEALLADKLADNIAEQQRIDVPNLLSFALPGNALHASTHVVVARAPRQGSPFCGATDFAGPVIEIATSANPVWVQPATIEFVVDVDQLAKTHVASLAIGLLDPTKQEWQLLPTEYDSTRRIARAQFWQPGFLALFFVNGVESIATSEHFSLLFESAANSANPAKSAHERAARALSQLEAALSHYRAAGYRVPNGSHWVCAGKSTISRARALLPAVPSSDLGKTHSHALARAAFLTLLPAYMNSHSVDGREFWFDSMANAIASRALGQRVTGNGPTFKRLSNSLLADDGPSAPLFSNIVARIIDQQVDLFRIWTDTTHIMGELDTRAGAEGQSRVLAVDMALEQITQKNLLSHYADFVRERLLNPADAALESSPSERCPSLTTIPADSKTGTIQLDVPGQYTARWACISVIVPTGKYRNIRLQLTGDAPAGMSLQLLRAGLGQTIESAVSAARPVRIDLDNSETLILLGVNSNMAQSAPAGLRYDDVSIEAVFEPATAITVRPAQIVSSTLLMTKIFPDIKNLDIEWDYGDGSPKERAHLVVGGVVRSEQPHAWAKSGSFTIRAAIFDAERSGQVIGFATKQVTVQPVQLDLSAKEANPQVQSDVRFSIRASGPLPDSPQFRLNFGDGSEALLVSATEAAHRFAKPGEYTVSAEVISASAPNEVIASAKTVLTVRAADIPAPVESPQPFALPASQSSASVQ